MIESHKPFQTAKPVLEKIIQAGFEAYFVGGSVRDVLLHKEISDVDIASSATPYEIKEIFSNTVDLGIEHGTVLVLEGGEGYEITTFRTEAEYEDFRHPSAVTFVRSLEEDLKRRDFTINALALGIDNQVIDYFEGKEDLERQVIRCVGNPLERFNEDALRMFRAVRFISQLNFQIDPATKEAITKLHQNMANVAVERMRVEWVKTMMGIGRKAGIHELLDTNLYTVCPHFNEMREALVGLGDNQMTRLTELQGWILLAYYADLSDKQVKKLMRDWKCSNQLMNNVATGLMTLRKRLEQDYDFFMAYDCQKELAMEVEAILPSLGGTSDQRNLEAVYKDLPIHQVNELALNGHDIIEILKLEKKGPIIGKAMNLMKEEVLRAKVDNTKEALTDLLLAADFV
ncbi:tRNA nucleotidyltransferase (CCA-adding enzyme) [Granulicatella balaenopterae]|uniref:CCA-adding enzyme n=1 Tax=Granulicatella balaenopterae TaxID=137733 RepID=A0A1H9JZF3_9LACT|nr:CCA tRNA nucleotidyltransferase [Granulicatella balaenopterae]SEQ92219.1 tRNA nucleotidyltransferase (CCA-adding enzyme) [Granulicatella balaenopterae]